MNKFAVALALLCLVLSVTARPQTTFPLPNFGEQGGVTALGTGGGSGTNGSIGLGLTHSTSHQLPDGPTVGSIFSLFGIGRK